LGDKIKKKEIGGVCSTYVGEKRLYKGFVGATLGKETTWKT
jgi:hypothetical protein